MSRSDDTKNAIAEAYRKLLATKSIDKITVSAIAQEAGVNRQTFYYHFHDIFDLLSWITHRNIQERLGSPITQDNWREGLLVSLTELNDNRELVIRTAHSTDSPLARRFIQEEVGSIVHSIVLAEATGLAVSERDIELVSTFYVAGLLEIVHLWIIEGMQDSPKLVVDRITRLLDGAPLGSLRNLSRP